MNEFTEVYHRLNKEGREEGFHCAGFTVLVSFLKELSEYLTSEEAEALKKALD